MASAQPNPFRSNVRLVFALDFGTTYTGFAHGAIRNNQTDLDFSEIQCITSWPSHEGVKVPSLIAEGGESKGNRQWGKDIDPASFVVANIKLELEPQERLEELRSIITVLKGTDDLDSKKLAESRNGFPKYPPKNAVEIVTNYLRLVREHVLEHLDSNPELGRNRDARALVPIDLVITVPVEWSEAARNRTFQAVVRAGFNERYFPTLRRIVMVPEPEAAAAYTLRCVHRDPSFAYEVHRDDSFVLCDAGGGTVDLASFQIIQTEPEFLTKKIGHGSGSRCGASFVDLEFKKWLQEKLGDESYNKLTQGASSRTVMGEHLRRIMNDFEIIKCAFGRRSSRRNRYIELPSFIEDDPDKDIVNGELLITEENMESFFEGCKTEIFDLIVCQITEVQLAGSTVRSIFVTGGFAESEYLIQEIRTFAQQRYIEVHRGPSPQSAVMIGAVARGMGFGSGESVSIVSCPQSFGVLLLQGYEAWRHAESDAVVDKADGSTIATGQVEWLMRKYEAVSLDRPKKITKGVSRRFLRASFGGSRKSLGFSETIVACKEERLPHSIDRIPKHMHKLYQLRYSLTEDDVANFTTSKGERDGKQYYTARLQLVLEVIPKSLSPLQGQVKATIKLHGKGLDSCKGQPATCGKQLATCGKEISTCNVELIPSK